MSTKRYEFRPYFSYR